MGKDFYQNNPISDQEEYLEYAGNFFLIDRGILKDVRVETKIVELPGAVREIRRQAFLNERLEGRMEILVVPQSVRKIERLSFAGMEHLRHVELFAGIAVLEPGVFRNCGNLERIVLPKSLARIESRAFENCTFLMEVVLQSSKVQISEDAFANCRNLKNKQIEEALEEEQNRRLMEEERRLLAKYPFLNRKKAEEEKGQASQADAEKTGEKEKEEPRKEETGKNGSAVLVETGAESVPEPSDESSREPERRGDVPPSLWPEGVNVNTEFCIRGDVLEQCEIGCPHIMIPEGVRKIAPEAFHTSGNRELLEQVELPEGLVEIGDRAFYGLPNLKEIRFPDSLDYIGAEAFADTAWLSGQRKQGNYVIVNGILISAFYESMVMEAKLPETILRIAPYAFYRSEAQLVIFSESVQEVDAYAFVESGVTEIDFSNRADVVVHTPLAVRCDKLREIYIPGKIERLDAGFVEDCPVLKRVCLKWSQTVVHKQAFSENVRIWIL